MLERVAAGDLDALEELYDRYKTMAYSIAYRITNDATLAEDVVQDAFLGAWRNAAKYVEGRGSVKTWLLSIVHHRAIDAIRRRRPTTELPESDGRAAAGPDRARPVGRGRGRPRRRDGPRCDGRPVAAQLEAIELAYFGGLTQQEIAERHGHAARDRQEPDAAGPAGDASGRCRRGRRRRRYACGGDLMTDPRPPAT